jgi:hypothetical protein
LVGTRHARHIARDIDELETIVRTTVCERDVTGVDAVVAALDAAIPRR